MRDDHPIEILKKKENELEELLGKVKNFVSAHNK